MSEGGDWLTLEGYSEIYLCPRLERTTYWFTVEQIVLEEEPVSIWSRMANLLISLAQITRDAVRLFRNSNRFLQELDGEFAVTSSTDLLAAHKRSMELLESWLSEEQLASLRERQTFEVVGNASGKRYRLHQKYSFGIEVLEGTDAGDLLCAVPHGASALGDILLAQKIGLETAERATLQRANRHSRARQAQYALMTGVQD